MIYKSLILCVKKVLLLIDKFFQKALLWNENASVINFVASFVELFQNIFLGNGEGVVSYRCIYRTQLEEEPCQFNLTDQVQILNEKEFNNQEEPLKIKLTVRLLRLLIMH